MKTWVLSVLLGFITSSFANAQATSSVLSEGNWYKIAVTETGIYKISYSDLQTLGINPASINPQHLKIFGNGPGMLPELNSASRPDDLNEISIKVVGENDGVFDADDYILFYGESPVTWKYNNSETKFEHAVNLYTDNTCYFLTTGTTPGKRITERASSTLTPTHTVTSFDDYWYHEAELYNFIKSGKNWFGEKFKTTLSYTFSVNFPDIDPSSPVKLYARLAARSANQTNFSIASNSQNILTVNVPAVNTQSIASSYAAATNGNGNFYTNLETNTIEINYIPSDTSSVGWLDYLTLNARRNLIFSGSQMRFRDTQSAGAGIVSKFTMTNSSGNIEVWDVTNRHAIFKQHQETPVITGEFSFCIPSDTLHEFIAFDNSSFLTPQYIGAVPNQNLHGLSSANLMIITPEIFLNEATQLANHHISHDNISTHVVTTAQIYNEFSSGVQDVAAIRDFVRFIHTKGQGTSDSLRFILLFGDASYDYKNRNSGNTNFVPSFQSLNSFDPTQSYITDDFFTLLDANEGTVSGSETMDIGIGRIPVKTQTEAQNAVTKIINYTTNQNAIGNWRTDVCFIADDAEDVTVIKCKLNI